MFKQIIAFALCLLLLASPSFAQEANKTKEWRVKPTEEFRGLWVTTVANLDYPTVPTADPKTLKEEADRILNDAAAIGFNAIVLQVRPSADAIYPSKLSPWSVYLTGEQGKAPTGGFDPLAYWIEGAHRRGLELHAWFNPYRVTRGKSELISTHIARKNPSWIVRHGADGNQYLNPGLYDVRKYITEVVMEVVRNYDVDGIHFDDYFYPGRDFNDAATFRTEGSGFATIDEWRVNNVDLLIKGVRDEIKAAKPDVAFGISPFGIWANRSSNSLGSLTSGHESYVSQYADTRKWVKYEWIDYIAPQLYWHIGYSIADYEKLAHWWAEVVRDTKVKLYIGLAGYKAGNADPSSPWHGVNEIQRQLDLNRSIPEIRGSILFRYQHLHSVNGLGSLMTANFSGKGRPAPQALVPESVLSVNRPTDDAWTRADKYFIGGASDPKLPLYLNGKLVEGRTKTGLFGLFLPLRDGENRFVFEQNGKKVTRVITKGGGSLAGPMKEIAIELTAPQTNQSLKPSQSLTLKASAPIGAIVTATLAGKKYTLVPTVASSQDPRPYATTFSLTVDAPNPPGNPRVVDHGHVRYQMSYGGKNYEALSPGTVRTIMHSAPYYAIVQKDNTDTYGDNSRQNGALYFLQQGMTDRIVSEDGNLAELSSGLWVRKDRIETSERRVGYNTIRRIDHREDPNNHYYRFTMNYAAVAYADYDGETVSLTVHDSTNSANFVATNPFLLGFAAKPEGSNTKLSFRFPEIGGYYLRSEENGFELVVRKKKVATSEDKPLSGISIMIDPGHGGSDSGAVSLYGLRFSEKHLMLHYSHKLREKLERLGAKVMMTRVEDQEVSLYDRLQLSRSLLPDLFLSLHADSMVETSDLSKISGFSIFYHDKLAARFAKQVKTRVVEELARKDRGAKEVNFYVVRGTWTPSVLLEAGFLSNPKECEELFDPAITDRYLDLIAGQIVSYFKSGSLK